MSECDLVLRISVTEDNFSQALALISEDLIDASWRVGEELFGGAIHEDSGANVILAEGVDLFQEGNELEPILRRNTGMISGLMSLGARMEVDLGLYSDGPATSVQLSKTALEQLNLLGLSVR